MNDKGSKFYYSRLTDGEKNLYDKISGALLRFEPAISLHAGLGKALLIDAKKIVTAVLFDNPVFFYVNRACFIVKQTPMYVQISFRYTHEKDEAELLWAQVEKVVDEFIADNIKPDMSPLAKQIKVHRFLTGVSVATEPYDRDCFSVIGALLNKKCVCEGFAKAYKLICDRLGIASVVVLGEAIRRDGTREPHAWNITRINGVTAHTDACWDSQFGVSMYDYFNLCDGDIAADHSFDATLYPKCEPNKINYFYKNGLVAADEEELVRIIGEQTNSSCFSVKLMFPYSLESASKLPFKRGEIRYNERQGIVSYKE